MGLGLGRTDVLVRAVAPKLPASVARSPLSKKTHPLSRVPGPAQACTTAAPIEPGWPAHAQARISIHRNIF